MAQQTLENGDTGFNARDKINDNFDELYGDSFNKTTDDATDILIVDTLNNFTATTVEGALTELFSNVVSGKSTIETAITTKGGTVSKIESVATFPELVDGIDSIPEGVSITGETTLNAKVLEDVLAGDTIEHSLLRKLADLDTLPSASARNINFSSDGTYLAITMASSPFLILYKKNVEAYEKLTDPVVMPTGQGRACCFSNNNDYLVVGMSTAPYMIIYKRSGDTFTKLTDPVVMPTGTSLFSEFSSDDLYMAVSHTTSPFVSIYKRSGDTFTKLANPSDLPPSSTSSFCLSWSPNIEYLTVGGITTPFIITYKRVDDTFTKVADPDVPPTGSLYSVDYSFDNTYMTAITLTSPYVQVYKRTGDSFVKLANPIDLPTSSCYSVAYAKDSNYMVVGGTTDVAPISYKIVSDVVKRTYMFDEEFTGTSFATCFSNSYFGIGLGVSPFVKIYKYESSFKKATNISGKFNGLGYVTANGTAGNNIDVKILFKKDGS